MNLVMYWRVLRETFWPTFMRQNRHNFHRPSVAQEILRISLRPSPPWNPGCP